MRLFAFLALAGAVTAFSLSSRSGEEQELKYKFVSQVITGIPQLNSQYSGFRLTGLSTIQPVNEKNGRAAPPRPWLTREHGWAGQSSWAWLERIQQSVPL